MRTFTTLLAIAAFALHLLLGCCWHHAHGADELPGHHHHSHGEHVHLPSWLWPTSHEHCDHHHHEHDDSGESESTPHAPCSDPQCVYLVVSQLTMPSGLDLSMPVALVEASSDVESSGVAGFEIHWQRNFSPHVRRHLALNHFLN